MKLVYLTAKRYPSTTADHIYIQHLAHAFSRELGDDFELIIAGPQTAELTGIKMRSVNAPRRLRGVFYFFWFPWYAHLLNSDTILFSNDLVLLSIAIFWRSLSRARYRVYSDWHLLTGTWRDSFVARRSDVLVATSERLALQLVRVAGARRDRVRVVYGGVDLALYGGSGLPTRSEIGLPNDKYLVGYVGLFKTLGNDKGISTMIEALRFLPEDVMMAFVGGSKEDIAEYAGIASDHGLETRCIFIERVPPERVPQYERAMDALVIPYPDQPHFRDFGFPMKTYEYLASGRPVIYSDLDILKEILNGRGVAFAPGNPASLSDAIKLVRSSQVWDERARINATEADRYSWERKAGEILSV